DTRRLVAAGDTLGCFYAESPSMRQLQRKAGVGDFDHLVIHSSIIRPAANRYIREYVRRLQGGAYDPIHPALQHTLDETYGIRSDTRRLVAAGDTLGCFYAESPSMRQLQRKAGVGDFDHLVIHSSIIRPAANRYIREYVRRLQGGAYDPIHPALQHTLDETYGI